jgi:NADPH:quinone reductase-like Zn-dependent oxidoreductase
MRMAALNHHDLWTLRGVSSGPVRPPQVLGCDGAGVVESYVDDEDTAVPVGTRVVLYPVVACGLCAACRSDDPSGCRASQLLSEPPLPGTLAEAVAVPGGNLVPLPESVGFVEAACLPTAYLTAYHMLFGAARLQPGQTVLVHGVSGGVPSAVILLAQLAGVTVYATSRDEAKRQLALDLGVEAAYPVERGSAREIVRATGGLGVDAVMETVGEPTWDLSLRAVRPGGTVVVSGATGGWNPPAQLNRIFFRRISVVGSTMGTRVELRRLVDLCATGALRPLVGATVPLADVAGAFADMARGELRGKITVRI